MSNEKKLVSHYELRTLLRKDGFGAVYLGQDTRDGREYALRVIELDSSTLARITGRARARSQRDHPLIEQIRQRMKRISELKHAHILPVIEFGEEHRRGNNDIIFYMVSPYERESLLFYWSSRTSSDEFISLEMIADLVFQAGEALFSVHKHGLIHQYVRLSSFMLRSSARRRRSPHLLLTDFWFADITAALLEEGQIARDLSLYLAPEQLSGRALATSDQYTLALLAYELLLGHRLSQIDLSPGLYARALRQRSAGVSAAELERAHRLDLVLARALEGQTTARFANIEEFVYTFRAVARGEAVDLSDEETFKLPVVGGEAAVAGAMGALAAEALAGEVTQAGTLEEGTTELPAAAQVAEQVHLEQHHGLHKTVLTSEGMEAAELAATIEGERMRVRASVQAFEDRETVELAAAVDEERMQARESGAAAFAAGLAVGEGQAFTQATLGAEKQARSMQEASLAAEGAGLLAPGAVASAGAYMGGMEAAQGAQATARGVAVAARRRHGRALLVAIAGGLLLVLLGGGLLVFAGSQASATVTLTLQSRTILNTYLVTAMTTTVSQGQAQAKTLTQTVMQRKTARASGSYPGARATGFLTFQHTATSCGCPIVIPAGTPFTSGTGVTVVTDYSISVAAQCVVTVPAHAVTYGPGGDIPAGSIHATFGAHIQGINRAAFAGGKSGQSNALIQQADISSLASTLQLQNTQQARHGLASQLANGQRLASAPLCRSQTAADHPAGAVATGVTVTVTTTCTAEAYDYAAVVQIVQQEVQAQAASSFSSDFIEVGTLQTTVTNATITDARTGTLLLAIRAAGTWVYRFSQNLKRSLARVIAGKDVNQVRALLNSEAGIAAVAISISGPNQNTLPSDDTKIAIVLKD